MQSTTQQAWLRACDQKPNVCTANKKLSKRAAAILTKRQEKTQNILKKEDQLQQSVVECQDEHAMAAS